MKTLALIVALLVLPAVAQAQAPDGYRVNIYAAGGTQPTTFFEYPMSGVTCNLAPITGTAVNPTTSVWDDPGNTGKVCRWVDPGTGPLFALPPTGSFEAGLQAYNAAGRGPESTHFPFSRLSAPTAAPTGFRLIRPGS